MSLIDDVAFLFLYLLVKPLVLLNWQGEEVTLVVYLTFVKVRVVGKIVPEDDVVAVIARVAGVNAHYLEYLLAVTSILLLPHG